MIGDVSDVLSVSVDSCKSCFTFIEPAVSSVVRNAYSCLQQTCDWQINHAYCWDTWARFISHLSSIVLTRVSWKDTGHWSVVSVCVCVCVCVCVDSCFSWESRMWGWVTSQLMTSTTLNSQHWLLLLLLPRHTDLPRWHTAVCLCVCGWRAVCLCCLCLPCCLLQQLMRDSGEWAGGLRRVPFIALCPDVPVICDVYYIVYCTVLSYTHLSDTKHFATIMQSVYAVSLTFCCMLIAICVCVCVCVCVGLVVVTAWCYASPVDAVIVCVSVSHASIVSKQLNLGKCKNATG